MPKNKYFAIVFIMTLLLITLSSCNKKTTEPNTQKVATPTFNVASGSYEDAQLVSISCATSGATIRYTTDGNDPTSSSTAYSSPINVSSSTTLKARAFKTDWIESSIASAAYTINDAQTVAAPTFNLPGGTYPESQLVSISSATSGATIRYTTNGNDPTSSSTAYSSPITVSSTTTIKAKGFKEGLTPSSISSAIYTIVSPPAQMVFVPGGTFTMGRTTGSGDDNELPTHNVTMNSFYMNKYLVTQAEYAAVMDPNPGVRANYPVHSISWYSALRYSNLRSMNEGLTPVYSIGGSTNPAVWGTEPDYPIWNAATCNWSANGYRLPTEAEWEYAARGATNNPDYLYSGSDDLNAVAWYVENNADYGSKPVGTKAPNALGLYDMSGNLYEWCWDWIDNSYYSSSPINNPRGPNTGDRRVLRGGDWSSSAGNCRVANRHQNFPSGMTNGVGFRVVRSGL